MAAKLLTAAGGGITLDAASTATDKTITIPADNGTLVYANTSGNVGIGTSSPVTKLDVAGAVRTSAGSDYGTFTCLYDGNLASYEIAFRTGLNNARTERARIDSSGNLLVGRTDANFTTGSGITMLPSQGIAVMKTSTANLGAGIYVQRVSGIGTGNLCEWAYNGSTVGTISTNGSTTTYGTSSDYRLKENIAPMTGALAKVAQLKPVTYTWKASQLNDEGFIAHELQEVCPSAVTGEKDGIETYLDEEGNEQTRPVYQGIDTSFLVATLTAAIQEQQAIIQTLTSRIEALENPQ